MKTIFFVGLLGLSLTLTAFAQKDVKKDQELFQGAWKFQETPFPDAGLRDHLIRDGLAVFQGSQVTFYITNPKDKNSKSKVAVLTLKLDPAKSPKTVDFTFDSFDIGNKDDKESLVGTTLKGIYAFEGKTLKVLFGNGPDKGRPVAFPKDKEEGKFVLIRAKP